MQTCDFVLADEQRAYPISEDSTKLVRVNAWHESETNGEPMFVFNEHGLESRADMPRIVFASSTQATLLDILEIHDKVSSHKTLLN